MSERRAAPRFNSRCECAVSSNAPLQESSGFNEHRCIYALAQLSQEHAKRVAIIVASGIAIAELGER